MAGHLKSDEKYAFFDTPEQCADAAAPIFEANRWRWTAMGVPNRQQILAMLASLRNTVANNPKLGPRCESGRLIYLDGQYGHERPPLKRRKGRE